MKPAEIRRRPRPAVTPDAALHPLLAGLYAARGVNNAAELGGGLETLLPPEALGHTEQAAALLHETMARDGRILIVGDYDADGATSSALGVLGLRRLGAKDVDYLVPNRFEFGYGLTPPVVELARQRSPELIVTVDNGIASHEGVAVANALGIKVLVTDHHLPGPTLPAAACIVNPNQAGDPFPSKALAGVGVMFYVLLALRRRLRGVDWFETRKLPEPNLADLLDLVALGTVADVAKLDRNNRVLVAAGLKRIRAGRGRPGIEALAKLAKRSVSAMTARDLGFAIGPRLNAAGRMEDMTIGIECLIADDPTRAGVLAARLDALNQERRSREGEMRESAFAVVERLSAEAEQGGAALPFGLCLHEPDWHEGLVGLVASRVRERVHRPVFAFAKAQDGKLKGSGRSIDGFHLRDALATIDATQPHLIERFGGHAMAAGLTLPAANYAAFAAAFDAVVRGQLDAGALQGVHTTDGELRAEWLSIECASLLREAGPWGNGFPEPVFDGVFVVNDTRIVGGRHLRLGLRAEGSAPGARPIPAIAFGWEEAVPPSGARLQLVYQLELDTYRDGKDIQLLVLHAMPA
jgi:single-stranded-DNA-specific exonuclease